MMRVVLSLPVVGRKRISKCVLEYLLHILFYCMENGTQRFGTQGILLFIIVYTHIQQSMAIHLAIEANATIQKKHIITR